MTPQSEFLVLAPVRAGATTALRALLATLNREPGHADPANPLLPFGAFPTLHVARLVVLDDQTLADNAAFGSASNDAPVYLAFLGDCDGEAGLLLDALAHTAGEGLASIFAHCEGFQPGVDLRAWMQARLVPSRAYYVNWVGRTVRQVKEEAALHGALAQEMAVARDAGVSNPYALQARLRAKVAASGLALTPPSPTPFAWLVRDWGDLLLAIVILAIATPLLLVTAPAWLWILRRRETTDPEIFVPPDPARVNAISAMEDHDVTNPFSAIGSIKPGRFRQAVVTAALWLLNFGARHLYTHGRLARVGTIHFARWVVIEDGRRVFFVSNYDGSLESYMDDFINKVAFGLNLVFSNGVGYPTTSWLLFGGAKREPQFKAFLRRRQQPTDVWYKAYPGLTAFDLARNSEIRRGLEDEAMGETAVRQWLAKI